MYHKIVYGMDMIFSILLNSTIHRLYVNIRGCVRLDQSEYSALFSANDNPRIHSIYFFVIIDASASRQDPRLLF